MLARYLSVRADTEALCEPLLIEDYVPQIVEFASPPKWHLAHVTWFFEEMLLKPYLPGYCIFDDAYALLFNSYYRTVGELSLRKHRGVMTRPSVNEVYRYRQHVDSAMQELLQSDSRPEVTSLVELGLNHEQQHQELLLMDLKYLFAANPIYPQYSQSANYVGQHNKQLGWLELEAGSYSIGHDGQGFGFDNELTQHDVTLATFKISKSLVTNGEYLEFIAAGGYQRFEYWHDEAWAWITQQGTSAPLYWRKIDGSWYQYTLAGLQSLDLNAILCHVSLYEAAAFANWRGMRLATEFEWEAAAPELDWGQRWEWTNSAYLPYPGFKINDGAVGEYNGKFMVNQWVLRGACAITPSGHSRITYRNFFHPEMRWMYSGIRLAC